ncbi:MAG: excinuclease ABC subunit UvrA [Clostridia bacterium]|nr:excinuclease ABC subunit UvrA [Clostridia bacterium]
MENNTIKIVGARENNLKNVSLEIPRNKLVVFTGLSGSGKSSLAFDTIFAEGQRRYMESLSSYARQFLGQMQKPDVDYIEGLSPAIAIDQKTTSANPRSTVGTVTEIYDYFRLLFAHIGTPYCPNCHTPIKSSTVDAIAQTALKAEEGSKLMVIAPVIRGKKGEYKTLFESFKKNGYVRAKVDGEIVSLDDEIKLDKQKKHTISVVIDRLIVREDIKSRLTESIESALKLSEGLVILDINGEEKLFSTLHSCSDCGFSFTEVSPRLFSFNTPYGACPECSGIGYRLEIDENLILKKPHLSINDGAISVSGWTDGGFSKMYFKALSNKYGFSLNTPVNELPREIVDIILYGTKGEELDLEYNTEKFSGAYKSDFEGIIPNLERRYKNSSSDFIKQDIERFMVPRPCECCHGKRLSASALSVLIDGKSIADVTDMSVTKVNSWIDNLPLTAKEKKISDSIIKEIKSRLKFLADVGLEYLTLSRSAGTLSGGEAQRIRLASQIGSALVGVLYVLDEPSIGLHPRDTNKLIKTLEKLRDLGNSVVVVEHDDDTIRSADFIVDVGPKAGVHGGEIVATGTLEDIMANEKSITGKYLSGARKIEVPKKRKESDGRFIEIIGAHENNLKNINVKIPLGMLTVVTGVSGSGKSSLVNEILYPTLATKLNGATKLSVGKCQDIIGAEQLDKVVVIDQSPIGRTPRSNPATYTGLFTPIRELFASTIDAKTRGYTASRFSFNVKGGRCEACGGDGLHKIEMHFLPDVYVTCDECHGKRYNSETLEVKYKGKNINDVLEMTVEDALKLFENVPSIKNKLQTLYDVGLSYIKLGQSATTLSGGEAQRVKLGTELSKRATGKTMYILDEPTTGLSTYDVHKLVKIIQRLVETGNSVVIIEHNLDIIKIADHIIDLGPEGGDNGGTIVAEGTPEEIVKVKNSYTGQALKPILDKEKN